MTDELSTSSANIPTDEQVREYMELHNADEVGVDNQWNMEEARYHLELDDEWYYKNKAHTPAPWERVPWDGAMEIRAKDGTIAWLGAREDGAIPNSRTKANARLIAKAPWYKERTEELLEACVALLDYLALEEGDTNPDIAVQARKAISKAKGK